MRFTPLTSPLTSTPLFRIKHLTPPRAKPCCCSECGVVTSRSNACACESCSSCTVYYCNIETLLWCISRVYYCNICTSSLVTSFAYTAINFEATAVALQQQQQHHQQHHPSHAHGSHVTAAERTLRSKSCGFARFVCPKPPTDSSRLNEGMWQEV